MSERRMFSKRITKSTRFLKMSPSAQSLYFHFGMDADDDGVVEAYPIMQMLGAAEDDFKILVAKEFIVLLNEDRVTFIKDWHEHNQIRADRQINSIYRDLLIKMMPEVKLVNPKPRSDVADNSRRIGGLSTDGIGEGSRGQVKLGKESGDNKSVDEMWISMLEPFVSRFPLPVGIKFENHWRAKQPNGKERWQLKDIFDIEKEVDTWLVREKEFAKK